MNIVRDHVLAGRSFDSIAELDGAFALHDKYDKPASGTLRADDINSFNTLLGARDAVDASLSLRNMWRAGTPWAADLESCWKDCV